MTPVEFWWRSDDPEWVNIDGRPCPVGDVDQWNVADITPKPAPKRVG